MPWVRRRYRGNKVWIEVGEADAPVLDARGLGKMRYKPEDDRTYTVKVSEVSVIEPVAALTPARSDLEDAADADAAAAAADRIGETSAPPAPAPTGAKKPRRPRKKAAPENSGAPDSAAPPPTPRPPSPSGADDAAVVPGDDIAALAGLAVHAYTDGASLGNPGPSGAGVVLLFREHRKEASVYLGVTTNNVAELTAVLEALRLVRRRDLPVRVHSDSSYAIGVLDGSYRPKANRELIEAIHVEMRDFKDLRFVKVEAHVGIEWNERADVLAGQAASSKRSSTKSV